MKTILIFFSLFLSISCIAQNGNSISPFNVHEYCRTDKSIVRILYFRNYKTHFINHFGITLPGTIAAPIYRKAHHNNFYSTYSIDIPVPGFDIISNLIDESMKYQVVKIVTSNSRAG
jgi:hypothetical protein